MKLMAKGDQADMKELNELMSPPKNNTRMSLRKKKPKASTPVTDDESTFDSPTIKKKKKIKIRLANPEVPDSFICEIFDSSLECDSSDSKFSTSSEKLNSSFEDKKNESSIKPRNYFDILMSKESRRNFNVISAVENEEIPEETKLLRVVECEDVINERKRRKQKNNKKLQELVKKNSKGSTEGTSDSSDDENLFTLKSKLRTQPNAEEVNSEFKENNKVEAEENENGIKRKTCILHYFSKIETVLPKPKKSLKNPLKDSKKRTESTESAGKCTANKEDVKSRKINSNAGKPKSRNTKKHEIAESQVDVTDEDELTVKKRKKIGDNKENLKLAPVFQKKTKEITESEAQTDVTNDEVNFPPKKSRKYTNAKETPEADDVTVKNGNDSKIEKNFKLAPVFRKKATETRAEDVQMDLIEDIPSKKINSEAEDRKSSKAARKIKTTESDEDEITVEDEKTGNVCNSKLAPIFKKKRANQIAKARLKFLHSGLPSSMKKQTGKTNFVQQEVVFFPSISHVQQKDDSDEWKIRNVTLPRLKLTRRDFSLGGGNFRYEIENEVETRKSHDRVESLENALKRIKSEYKNVNVDGIYERLKEKKEKFAEKTKEVEKTKAENKNASNGDDSVESIEECFGGEICNALWVEKYKLKSDELFGNEIVAKKLHEWLKSWKNFDEEIKKLPKNGFKAKKKPPSGDSDDFATSDEEDRSVRSPNNACMLNGPVGCGKTALVFALAGELEFNVLEINASSKRTGKKLLTDLQEATQSHIVRHDVGNQQISNLLEKENKKKSKNKKKKKKKEIKENRSDHQNNCKISLILIEDADIVFDEHDEGFVPAIATLIESSKRPVIFLSNDPYCGHLNRFKTKQCLMLEMKRPNFYSSCALLESISVLEGVSLQKEAIKTLIHQNHCDLRKSLLELQFWIQFGRTLPTPSNLLSLGQVWWGLNRFLYNKDIKHEVKVKSVKRKRINDLFDSSEDEAEDANVKRAKLTGSETKEPAKNPKEDSSREKPQKMEPYCKILNCLSTADVIFSSDENEPVPDGEYSPKDSLSLNENIEPADYNEKKLSSEVVNEMIIFSTRIFGKEANLKQNSFNTSHPSWEELCWRKQQKEAKRDLISLMPINGGKERKSMYLDYLPIIRNICRSEKNRYFTNTKRKNRFYHYLRNLGAEPSDENLDINCEVLGT